MKRTFLIVFSLIFILTGCLNDASSDKELDYDQTKKMVVDILQTDEGKKVLQEIIADDKMKQHLIMESDVVENSIKKMFASKTSTEMWKQLFEDPSFVKSYQKSMEDEQKDLFKSLMYDAAFQKQMLNLLQNPEMSEQTLTVLKGHQFRKHLEETIQETLDTPLFQSKIQHLLLEAAEKELKKEEKNEEKDKDKEENNEDEDKEEEASNDEDKDDDKKEEDSIGL